MSPSILILVPFDMVKLGRERETKNCLKDFIVENIVIFDGP